MHQKSAIFATTDIFLDKEFNFQPDICNWCYDLLMMSMNLRNIGILNIHGDDYCCVISKICKVKLETYIDLTQKSGTL